MVCRYTVLLGNLVLLLIVRSRACHTEHRLAYHNICGTLY